MCRQLPREYGLIIEQKFYFYSVPLFFSSIYSNMYTAILKLLGCITQETPVEGSGEDQHLSGSYSSMLIVYLDFNCLACVLGSHTHRDNSCHTQLIEWRMNTRSAREGGLTS